MNSLWPVLDYILLTTCLFAVNALTQLEDQVKEKKYAEVAQSLAVGELQILAIDSINTIS